MFFCVCILLKSARFASETVYQHKFIYVFCLYQNSEDVFSYFSAGQGRAGNMSHKVTIQVLPRVSHFIKVQQAERSVHELLNTSDLLTNKSLKNVRLIHPPVVVLKEGGGGQLLNKSSLIHQLECYQGVNQKSVMPHSLMTYVIDFEGYDKEEIFLYQFLFSQLELLHYQKKIGKNMLWEMVIRQIEEDSYLKSIVEDKLFKGESLAPRHYHSLLSAVRLSSSAIDHKVSDIRSEVLLKSGKDNSTPAYSPER